jgi:hypothetical protein
MFVIEEGTVVVEARAAFTASSAPAEFVGELTLLVLDAHRVARVRAATDGAASPSGATTSPHCSSKRLSSLSPCCRCSRGVSSLRCRPEQGWRWRNLKARS